MKHTPVPAADRVAAVRRTDRSDGSAQESVERLARLAGRLMGAPVALVGLVDEERQFVRSCIGLSEPWTGPGEPPLSDPFCRHVVDSAAPLVIDDAREHPLVRGEPGDAEPAIVAYAGVPLAAPDGAVLGSLCVIDRQPRHWTDESIGMLEDLAAAVTSEIRLRESLRAARDRITEAAPAAELLRQREAQLVEAQAIAGIGSWEWDVAANRITWSAEQFRIHGREPLPEVTFQWFFSHVHPDDQPWMGPWLERALAAGESFEFAYRIVRPDGELRWLYGRGRTEVAPDGRPLRMIGTSQDITEQKATEQALVASEEGYRTLFDLAGDALFVHDPETGAVLDANRHACEIYGCSLDELRTRGLDIIGPDNPPFTRARALEHIRRAADGEPQRFEWLVTGADGTPTWAEVSLHRIPIRGRYRVIANLRNIQERKAVDEELRRLNQELEQRVARRTEELQQRTAELEAVFQALPDMYFRLARDGSVLDYRAGLSQDLVLPPELFLGRGLSEMLGELMPGEAAERIRSALEAVNRTGELVCVEYPMSVYGTRCEFEARLLPLGDESLVAIVREITHRKEAERALQERETRFRRLTENSSDLVQIIDPDGRMGYTGPSVVHLLGYTPEEVAGRPNLDFIHPADRPAVAETVDAILAAPGMSRSVRYRVRHKDGRWRVFEAFGRTLLPDSAAEGLVCNARDITERHEAEEALRRSEEYFRSLIENGSDIIIVVGADGINRYVSPSVRRALGYEPHELIGTPVLNELIHPESHAAIGEVTQRAAANPGASFGLEFRARHRDGSWRTFETLGRTLLTDSAEGGFVINARDVTERKQFEEGLRRSEARYRSLIENAHDIVTILDLEGRVTYQSPQLQRVLGYDPEEMLGENALGFVHPDDVGLPARALERILESPGGTQISEYRFRHRDGSWRYLETFGRALVPDDPSQGLVFNSRDVTERRETERLLQEREEHFRKLIEKSGDMVQLLDATGRITYTGPSVSRMLGYSPEEIQGTGALEYVHPDDVEKTSASLAEMLARPEEVVSVEYRVRHRAGHYRMFEAFARTISLANGERVVVVNARDVTDRREAEAALDRQREYFELLLASVEAGIAAWDPQCRFEYVSTNAVVDPEARAYIIGKTHAEYYAWCGKPQEVAAQRHHHVEQAILMRRPTEFEDPVPLPDGSTGYMLRRYWPVFDAAGEVERVIGYSVDITERKRAEEALARQREYYEQLISSADAGLAAWDAQGRFEYISPSALPDAAVRAATLGKTQQEYCAMRGLPDTLAELRGRPLARALETRSPTEFEEALQQPDGSIKHMLRRYSPLLNDAGEVERVIGYSIDITERKRTEEAVQRATEEAERAREAAERANRAKSEFLSRMSHELRTPMNSILGFAQLLDRAALPPEHGKGVGHILKAGRHLLQLINEVLEIARIEAGRHSLSLEPVRLGTALQEAVALVRPLAAQWRVELDEGPWPCCAEFVQADRQRLTQVLLNLLGNAIKYNRPGGRVRVSCAAEPRDGEPPRLVLRVEDTGRGIPADRADQLFTPFARLGAEQSEVEGTGLGLALSQRLTEAMGGTLTLESSGVEGSVFRLELQRATEPLRRLEEQGAAPTSLDGAPHAPATLLYIEDNLANLSLVETILLSRPRWRTMPALQGQIGVELAREHVPDLILLDLHLPDIHGEEVLRRLRAEPRTAGVPVVVITADATRGTVERLRAAGADAYLTKPLDVDEFLETLERFLPRPAAGA